MKKFTETSAHQQSSLVLKSLNGVLALWGADSLGWLHGFQQKLGWRLVVKAVLWNSESTPSDCMAREQHVVALPLVICFPMVLLYVKKTTCCCFTFSYLFPNGLAVCQENNMLALYRFPMVLLDVKKNSMLALYLYSYLLPNCLAVCQENSMLALYFYSYLFPNGLPVSWEKQHVGSLPLVIYLFPSGLAFSAVLSVVSICTVVNEFAKYGVLNPVERDAKLHRS